MFECIMMYFNTTRWAIDITLSIGFLTLLVIFLLIRLVKLEKEVMAIPRK